jgi:glycine/D-amino acid oxidase-like deaminating enzyme/nitrite reductase/ring-hydroxylating ferredoxin subunit
MHNHYGLTQPLWLQNVDLPDFPPLQQDTSADVCIVGAGIAGLTTAYLLAQAGRRVVVLSELPIGGGGESARTSAHLASANDDRFETLEKTFGAEGSYLAARSHHEAIDTIERICGVEGIDCDFARLPGYLFLAPDSPPDLLDRELHAARRAQLACELLDRFPGSGFDGGRCLRFDRQARFHPMRYLAGLARAISRLGGRIHCGSRVAAVEPGRTCTIRTVAGPVVTAAAAVAATNAPSVLRWNGIYTKQAPYRTYIVCLRIPRDSVSDALYWDSGDPYHYVRIARDAGGEHLIVGGEDHKVGQMPAGAIPFENLEQWARRHFPAAADVIARWSGQVQEPDDYLAFLGRAPGLDNCYVISGDSGMGLTHGTIGGIVVSSLITSGDHPWARLYDPGRLSGLKAPAQFVRENLNAAGTLVRDYLSGGEVDTEEQIPPGSGAVVRSGIHKLAVYRDDAGGLHRLSAACTHMQCIVQWNAIEKSWDCPCHGSRFTPTGQNLIGPATKPLAQA